MASIEGRRGEGGSPHPRDQGFKARNGLPRQELIDRLGNTLRRPGISPWF